MRIYANRFYVIKVPTGISGFQGEPVDALVTGQKARSRLIDHPIEEYVPAIGHRLELDDGHLPGHRPVVDAQAALVWLEQNPWNTAYFVRS